MRPPIEFRQLTGGDMLVNEWPELKALYTPSQLQFHFRTLAKRLLLVGRVNAVPVRVSLDCAEKRAKKAK